MHHCCQLILLVLLLGGAVHAQDVALEDRAWLQVTSENFRIKSVLSEERTKELLRQLEIMRSSLGGANSAGSPVVRTVILAVDNHADYVSIGAPAYSAGFFISTLRENAILINEGERKSAIQVILHEYAHFLNLQNGRIRYPRWYEEGNAEYVSHADVQEQSFVFGLAPAEHLATLSFASWLPLQRVLEVTDTSTLNEMDGTLFYGQSWLLVHYLRSLPDADQNMSDSLAEYARLVSAATPPALAFEQAFDLDIELLEAALLKYFLDRQFASREVPINRSAGSIVSRTRTLSKEEAQLALAQMALRLQSFVAAEHWFRSLLADNELRAHGEAGLGRVAGQRGDIETADQHFATAIRLMAWDFDIWMDYAQYWALRLSTSYDVSERARNASRLIDSLESALTIAAATPELNSLMGLAYLAEGTDIPEAIQYLEEAARAAPHDQPSRLLLAHAYLYAGDFAAALEVAESVLVFEHEPNEVTAAAHELIELARNQRIR